MTLVRPIGNRKGDRVRAHVFLSMLAYYLGWHMRKRRSRPRSSTTKTVPVMRHVASPWWHRLSGRNAPRGSDQADRGWRGPQLPEPAPRSGDHPQELGKAWNQRRSDSSANADFGRPQVATSSPPDRR